MARVQGDKRSCERGTRNEERFKDTGKAGSYKNKEARWVRHPFPLTSTASETEWRESSNRGPNTCGELYFCFSLRLDISIVAEIGDYATSLFNKTVSCLWYSDMLKMQRMAFSLHTFLRIFIWHLAPSRYPLIEVWTPLSTPDLV